MELHRPQGSPRRAAEAQWPVFAETEEELSPPHGGPSGIPAAAPRQPGGSLAADGSFHGASIRLFDGHCQCVLGIFERRFPELPWSQPRPVSMNLFSLLPPDGIVLVAGIEHAGEERLLELKHRQHALFDRALGNEVHHAAPAAAGRYGGTGRCAVRARRDSTACPG